MKKSLIPCLIILLVFSLSGFAAAGDSGQEDGYSLSLRELIKQAEDNIEKVDSKLEAQKAQKENEKREALARGYFEKGNNLYEQGKLKEARAQWQKALDLTSHPDMKEYIKQSDKKVRAELRSQNITQESQDDPERGYVLQEMVIEEKKLDAKPVPKKTKSSTVKKIKPAPKPKTTLKSKVKSTIKEESSQKPKGFVFEGSSLVDKDVKEEKQTLKSEIETKPETKSEKKSEFKWWWQKKKTDKAKTPAKEEVSEKGYTFEGSCLIKNDTKESKKKPSSKHQKSSKPAKRKAPSKNKNNKMQKSEREEPEPPKRGYDIFVK